MFFYIVCIFPHVKGNSWEKIRVHWFLFGSNADSVVIKRGEDEKIQLLIRFKQIKHAQPTVCLHGFSATRDTYHDQYIDAL